MVIMADIGCMHRSSLDCREGPHPLWLLPASKKASALSGLSLDVWREFSRPRRPARRRPTDANVVPRVAKRCDLRLLFTNGTACSFRVFFLSTSISSFLAQGISKTARHGTHMVSRGNPQAVQPFVVHTEAFRPIFKQPRAKTPGTGSA